MARGDSVTRYHSAGMNNVRAPKASPSARSGARDSISSAKEVHVRYIPKRVMTAGDMRFSKDRLVYVGRAGRFVFKAVCLPPYIVLYGIPKWMVIHMAPKLVMAFQVCQKYGANFLNNIKTWVASALMKPFRDASNKIKFAIQEVAKSFKQLVSKMVARVVRPIHAALKAVQNIRITPFIPKISPKATLQKLRNLTLKPLEKLNDLATAALDIPKKIIERAKLAVKRVQSAVESVKNKAQSAMQMIVSIPSVVAMPAINLFIQTRHTISEWGKASLRRVKKANELLQKGARKVKSALDSGKKFLAYFPKKAKEKTEKLVKIVKDVLAKVHFPFYKAFLKFFAKVSDRLGEFFAFAVKKLHFKLPKIKLPSVKIPPLAIKYPSFKLPQLKLPSWKLEFKLKLAGAYVRAVFRTFGSLYRELQDEVRSWIS